MDDETGVMDLIVHAGNARSLAMEAIAQAKKGLFEEVSQKLQESRDAMGLAHKQQTEILEQSLDNPDGKISMLMIHAQDHLMNAISILDMAQEFCELYELLQKNTRR